MNKLYAILSPTLTQEYTARFFSYFSFDHQKVEDQVNLSNTAMKAFFDSHGESEIFEPYQIVEIPLEQSGGERPAFIAATEYCIGDELWSRWDLIDEMDDIEEDEDLEFVTTEALRAELARREEPYEKVS